MIKDTKRNLLVKLVLLIILKCINFHDDNVAVKKVYMKLERSRVADDSDNNWQVTYSPAVESIIEEVYKSFDKELKRIVPKHKIINALVFAFLDLFSCNSLIEGEYSLPSSIKERIQVVVFLCEKRPKEKLPADASVECWASYFFQKLFIGSKEKSSLCFDGIPILCKLRQDTISFDLLSSLLKESFGDRFDEELLGICDYYEGYI
jgi:hypothetical protein